MADIDNAVCQLSGCCGGVLAVTVQVQLRVICEGMEGSTIFEIFNFRKCRDLKLRVRGHSIRSSEQRQIDPLPMTSY